MWADVVIRNEYRLPDKFDAEDIIVDIGSHVGSFAKACLDRGAGLVICFEPDGQNFEDLSYNMKAYTERTVLIRAAAWASGDVLPFARPLGAEHTGGGSVVSGGDNPTLVRAVDAVAMLDAVIGVKEIRLLKLDCEGAEWELLAKPDLYDRADAIAMEWHENTASADLDGLRSRLEKRYQKIEVKGNVTGLGWLFAS